jgi:hypothetical protein
MSALIGHESFLSVKGARLANTEVGRALNVLQQHGALLGSSNLAIPMPAALRAAQLPSNDMMWGEVQAIIPPKNWASIVEDVFGDGSSQPSASAVDVENSLSSDIGPAAASCSSSSNQVSTQEYAHEVFELRKKLSFFFAEMASVSGEMDGNDEIRKHLLSTFISVKPVASPPSLVALLIDALLVRGCSAAGSLLRCLWCRVPSILAATMTPRPTTVAFRETVLGRLMTSRLEKSVDHDENAKETTLNPAASDGAVAVESWRCIHTLLTTNGAVASECLRSYLIDASRCFCQLLSCKSELLLPSDAVVATSSCRFLNQWQTLRLLTSLLGETIFGKLRTLLAESPAILCAVLQFVQSSSTHLRFEAYHCIKVFIAKPNKPPPMRYLMWINRDVLMKFVIAHHQHVVQQFEGDDPRRNPMNAAGGGGGSDVVEEAEERERERDMLQDRLIHLQPLSREETLLLLKE